MESSPTILIYEVYEGQVHLKCSPFEVTHKEYGTLVHELHELFHFQMPPVCLCVPWSVALKATMVLPALMLQKPTQIMRPRSTHVTCVEDRLGLWLGHICTKAVASNNTLHGHHTQTSQDSGMARLFESLVPRNQFDSQEPSSTSFGHGKSCTGCLPQHSIQHQTILFCIYSAHTVVHSCTFIP